MFSARVVFLGLMKFLVTFVYTVLFVNKDTIIATSPELGPAAIPVLKGAVMMAVAFMISGYYGKLTAKYSLNQVMKAFLLVFSVFFLLYGWVLYPQRQHLDLNFAREIGVRLLGEERSYVYGVVVHWYHSLFFVAADLWGQFMIVTLFWGVANSFSRLEDAKKTYAFYTAAGNLATLFSGMAVGVISTALSDFQTQTQALMAVAVILSVAMYFCLLQLDKEMESIDPGQKPNHKKSGSFFDSFKIVLNSKHLLAIFFVVAGFGFTMNMVEFFWKDALRSLYPNPSDYRAILGEVVSIVGFVSTLMALFMAAPMLRFLSWRTNALIPPVAIGLVACGFLGGYLVYYAEHSWFLWKPSMAVVVILGSVHNICGKVLKYTIFDPTKEMALIPIPYDEKVRGKAAVDVLSSRLAKSGSSWVLLAALELSGHVISSASFLLAPLLFLTFLAWIYGVFVLDKRIGESV